MAYKRDSTSSLSDSDFQFICQFAYQQAGIVLNDNKREMVYRRLARIVRERKLSSFAEYCQLLKENPEQEQRYFINAITTNLTSFFREQHHFDYLAEYEIAKILRENAANKRIRVWSSASSTGEEPYSIAITFFEAMATKMSQWDVKILATDIDCNVLNMGKQGIYEYRKIASLPSEYINKYFSKVNSSKQNTATSTKYQVNNNVRQLITFKQLNLLHQWPMKGPFDIIFCRNVIIYFDKKTQQELFERYNNMLKPGGLLILGHSENLGNYQQYFENVGRTIFRKPLICASVPNMKTKRN